MTLISQMKKIKSAHHREHKIYDTQKLVRDNYKKVRVGKVIE